MQAISFYMYEPFMLSGQRWCEAATTRHKKGLVTGPALTFRAAARQPGQSSSHFDALLQHHHAAHEHVR